MKKAISALLSLILLLSLLSACQRPAAESDPPVSDPISLPSAGPSTEPSAGPVPSASTEPELLCNLILNQLWPELGFGADNMDYYSAFERETLAVYIEGAYGLAQGEWEDGGVCRKTGASAGELAVLCFADEAAAQWGEDCLRNYLHSREGDFTGYAPDQAKLVADAVICRQGLYVGLLICEDTKLAQTLFTASVESVRSGELTLEPEPIQDVDELMDRLLDFCREAGDDVSKIERIGSGGGQLSSIVEGEYGLSSGAWKEAAVARGTGGSVFELAVLSIGDEQAARDVSQKLNGYLDGREEKFARLPAQAEQLHDAVGWHVGEYCALLVCADPEGAIEKLRDDLCLNSYGYFNRHQETVPGGEQGAGNSGRVKFVQPNKDDMSIYDTAAIRGAWAQGDPSGLSEYDRAIYDSAEAVLAEILTGGMSDLDKETAIYTWLTDNVVYDWTHQDVMRETPRESFTPYGGLVNRKAVCLGYAASFQLLMDLTGVECITVVGAAFNSEEDHAWNMVRLNGNWYCVDVTWDANGREQLGDRYQLKYFNITSDEMAKNHQWDYDNTPEATAKDKGRG